MKAARNVAIIVLLALGVGFLPGGGNAVHTVTTAIVMGFLAGITWMLYTLSRQNQLTLATLSDGRRAIFSVAIWGAARFADLSQEERRLEAGVAAVAAALALLATIVIAVVVMTSK